MDIAEDILWTYSRKKFQYQSARNKFFKERVIGTEEKIKDKASKFDGEL